MGFLLVVGVYPLVCAGCAAMCIRHYIAIERQRASDLAWYDEQDKIPEPDTGPGYNVNHLRGL